MSMEWKEYKLGEVLTEKGYVRGPFGSALRRGDMKETGVPVYEQQHAIYGVRTFRFFVDDEKYNEMKRFSVAPNDLIISCSGTVGEVSIIRETDPIGIISQALLLLRVNREIITPEYLYYFFKTRKGHNSIIERSSGSVQVNISKRNVIEQIPLILPNIDEQNRIVDILSSLDAKIENNNKINAKLEEMTQALFKSWFIDFEPFKDGTFVESELGLIPSWFPIRTLGDIVSVSKKSINPGKTPEEIFAHYSLPAFDAKHSPEMQEGSTIMSNKFVIDDNTVLLSKLNPHIKRIWFVDKVKENAICSTEFIPFKANVKHIAFVYCLLNSEMFYKKICGFVNGATTSHQRLHAEDILNLKIAFDDDIMNVFCNRVDPMLRTICANIEENIVLAQTRDTLLPKLMSGEIVL